MSEAIKEAEKILKQYYGYDHFREGQIPVIKAVLGGRDVLGIMPTGAGKSVLIWHFLEQREPGMIIRSAYQIRRK